MSTSNPRPIDTTIGSDVIPSWIQTDTLTDPANVSMREVMTRFLFQAPSESVLSHTLLMITQEHLVSCSPTY